MPSHKKHFHPLTEQQKECLLLFFDEKNVNTAYFTTLGTHLALVSIMMLGQTEKKKTEIAKAEAELAAATVIRVIQGMNIVGDLPNDKRHPLIRMRDLFSFLKTTSALKDSKVVLTEEQKQSERTLSTILSKTFYNTLTWNYDSKAVIEYAQNMIESIFYNNPKKTLLEHCHDEKKSIVGFLTSRNHPMVKVYKDKEYDNAAREREWQKVEEWCKWTTDALAKPRYSFWPMASFSLLTLTSLAAWQFSLLGGLVATIGSGAGILGVGGYCWSKRNDTLLREIQSKSKLVLQSWRSQKLAEIQKTFSFKAVKFRDEIIFTCYHKELPRGAELFVRDNVATTASETASAASVVSPPKQPKRWQLPTAAKSEVSDKTEAAAKIEEDDVKGIPVVYDEKSNDLKKLTATEAGERLLEKFKSVGQVKWLKNLGFYEVSLGSLTPARVYGKKQDVGGKDSIVIDRYEPKGLRH